MRKSSYTRYQIPFCLWQVQPLLKHCKSSKYYEHDCLQTFVLLSTSSMMIHVFEKSHTKKNY